MTQKTLVFLTDNTSLPPLTHFNMGNRAASLQDLNIALSAEPNNPAYR